MHQDRVNEIDQLMKRNDRIIDFSQPDGKVDDRTLEQYYSLSFIQSVNELNVPQGGLANLAIKPAILE